jgi:glycosyltransferase involved in cell wall biosynthesis
MPGASFVRVGGTGESGSCRILYVVGQLHTGGLERQLYYLLRFIDRDRYKPVVVVGNCREGDVHVPPIRALGVPLYSISNTSSRMSKLTALRRLVRELRPEVVHSYSFHTNVAASWAALGTPAVAVGSVRSDFNWAKKGSGALLGRLSAKWPAYQVCNTYAAAASARSSRSFFAPAQCDVVSNALDLERFQGSAVRTEGPARIVGLGYLLPVKRWDRLLRAAQVLKRRHLDYEIDIVGGGPLRRELEQHAQRLDILDRVRFVEHTDDVAGVLAGSSFVVLTSETEGCPNAVMEAMACSRPVVATDVGDVPRLVDDGTTGFLVRSGDESMLVERMTQLIGDRQLCCRMGEAARRKAEREFGLERLVSETLAAYRRAGWNENGVAHH